MKQETILEKYPVFVLEIDKKETPYQSVDAIFEVLKAAIDKHPIATFIDIFDHYKHTCSLESGMVHPDIVDAKNIVFCFGEKLPDPKMLAVRPRSIGVADLGNHYVISFLEAPMQPMNVIMEGWVKALANKEVQS
jgi:hypothetical protein